MIKKVTTLIFAFIICVLNFASAQDTLISYYNKDWTKITDKNQASYYRKAVFDGKSLWTTYDYFMNNKIQMIGTYKDKKLLIKQGHFIFYYENGKKQSEGDFENNKNEGQWTYWFENGQKKSEGKFEKDLRQSTWIYWHENGQKKSEGLYVNNNEEAKWFFWFDSGEKSAEGKYLKGVKDATWQYLYKTGQIETEEVYKSLGLTSIVGYFENGSIKYKCGNVTGNGDGEWTYWNIDGKIFLQGTLKNQLKVGEWTRFFANGESLKVYYENGTLVSKQLGSIYKNK